MNEQELNAWAAEWLGWTLAPYNPLDGHVYLNADGEPAGFQGIWNPCQDRNQAQLVVEKINQEHYQDRFMLALFDLIDPDEVLGWEPHDAVVITSDKCFKLLTLEPVRIIEAAHKAVTSTSGSL